MFNFKEKPYHLLLLPLFFTCKHLFAIVISNPPSVVLSILNFFGSIALCMLFSFGIYFIFSRLISKVNASLIAALVFCFIFFFQDILLLINDVQPGNLRIRWLITAGSGVVLVLVFFIYRSRTPLLRWNEFLNLVSGAFLAYLLVTLMVSYSSLRPNRLEYEGRLYQKTCTDCPDIYFFLLDSYTSNSSLKTYFNYDNSKIKNGLTDLGFIVKDTAYSDYFNTLTSLSSTFNLGDIPDLESYYKGDLHRMIKNNTTARTLKSWGYEIHNYSIFDVLDQPRFYSITFDIKPQFVNTVFQNTVFHLVFEYFETNSDMYSIHRNILRLDEEVANIKHPSPSFVYSHLLAPHPPYVIDSLGNEVPFSKVQGKDSKQAYLDEVKGLNTLLLKTITAIRKSSPNAIIMVQGDHGFRSLPVDTDKEAHTVFFAYFGPNASEMQKLTSSNEVFRVVLGSLGHN